jgi:hypothetical protein
MSLSVQDKPKARTRLIISVCIGILSGLFSAFFIHIAYSEGGDFTWPLLGARALLQGVNPYIDSDVFPMGSLLFYPLPALLVAIPFTIFPHLLAAALFFGISSGLLAWGITRDGYSRLPLFISSPFWISLFAGQWAPLIVAAALLPGLLPLALCKPNIGLPLFVAYPSRRGMLASLAVLLLSLLILPSWPRDWLANLGDHANFVPLLTLPGSLLLLALIRWRETNARLLLALAVMPQRMYDPLALWLLPRTFRQSLILSVSSWGIYVGLFSYHPVRGPVLAYLPVQEVVILIYLPALFMVLQPVGSTLMYRLRRGHSMEATDQLR